jgi:hypothetical protein
MFALTQVVPLPGFDWLSNAALAWPELGALLAVTVVAVLIAASLGMLREHSYKATRARNARLREARRPIIEANGRHLQAA